MKQLLKELCKGETPFCIIQKQDSEDILILSGTNNRYRRIHDIPRKKGSTDGSTVYDTISVIPFCQIRERGYNVRDEGEEILSISVNTQREVDADALIELLPSATIHMSKPINYDCTEIEYGQTISNIVNNEIGNGEGANFVIPRNAKGTIENFSVEKGLSIFKSLLEKDYGTYWKFIFFDTTRFFIGSTPERHLLVKNGKVRMNPISGTFRKDRNWERSKDFKKDLMNFLTDQKEINELFMVVDEELKMMAKMCSRGGTIVGPILKEMSQLIHSEYLLSGESDKDIFDLFTDSMFAATVVGSPVENGCNIIKKYSTSSRRYYGSALMLVGRDEDGADFLDSPITIRTAEIDTFGKLYVSVGATLVKDSVPEEEVRETEAKGAAILASIIGVEKKNREQPLLARFYNDDEIIETLVQRNQNLSKFWFFKQDNCNFKTYDGNQPRLTLIHNEDDFVYMLQHMFNCIGVVTSVVRFNEYDITRDTSDITLLGPGPGNPNEDQIDKIAINMRIAKELLEKEKKALFICLGHQILCRTLGFKVKRKKQPLQGSQMKIELFGRSELVGFYNTFAAQIPPAVPGLDFSTLEDLQELVAIKGKDYISYQFHPESLLTENGYVILQETLQYLLSSRTAPIQT